MKTDFFSWPIMKRPFFLLVILSLLFAFVIAGCGGSNTEPSTTTSDASTDSSAESTGTLSFTANGEDFVRQGFVSKDGWQVSFDHLYVTLADVTAYQTDPPYDPFDGAIPEGMSVAVSGPLSVDLAAGDESAEPILIEAAAAVAGQYNALGWRMVPATAEEVLDDSMSDAIGSTIFLKGQAEREGEVVTFSIRDESEYAYNCGEFVGESRLGILDPGGSARMEATFHFDHLFGDADTPADEALNVNALGFDPLAALAQDGALVVSVGDLETQLDNADYELLSDALAGLGHVGEGHCYEATGGYTGHSE